MTSVSEDSFSADHKTPLSSPSDTDTILTPTTSSTASTVISDEKPFDSLDGTSSKPKSTRKHAYPKISLFSKAVQLCKIVFVVTLLISSSVSITTTQLIGYPLYYVSKDWYRAWMDWTKQLFGILLTFNAQFSTPLRVHTTGNKTVQGVFRKNNRNGHLESAIEPRTIVISNHQLYTDWVYLWWIAFTANSHGSIYIMLKKSLEKIPLWGWGMKNYRFLFLSRSWAADEKTLTESLSRINQEIQYPAWLVLFPEGTTISQNGVNKTRQYSQKFNPPLPIPKNVLIPRARGLRYSLQHLHETVEYLYDATIYYDGLPEGEFGEEFFSLKRMFFYNEYPKDIHFYWRRYRVVDIPWKDEAAFEAWLQARWAEKDRLIDSIRTTGQFQPLDAEEPKHVTEITDKASGKVYKIEEGPSETEPEIITPVELDSITSMFQIFIVPVTTALIARLGFKFVQQLL